jgi:hypothetical protein
MRASGENRQIDDRANGTYDAFSLPEVNKTPTSLDHFATVCTGWQNGRQLSSQLIPRCYDGKKRPFCQILCGICRWPKGQRNWSFAEEGLYCACAFHTHPHTYMVESSIPGADPHLVRPSGSRVVRTGIDVQVKLPLALRGAFKALTDNEDVAVFADTSQ